MSLKQTKKRSPPAQFYEKLIEARKIIKENKGIKRYPLCIALKVTPKQMESIHPALKELYEDEIEYVNKEWREIESS